MVLCKDVTLQLLMSYVEMNRARRTGMFHITTSSPSLFVCFARCTGDDLQSVCIWTHSRSYSQNSKGKKGLRWIISLTTCHSRK